ncbi:MAG: protease pro-enzyme activation domain-containing protein [Phycisphaerales bacterium]
MKKRIAFATGSLLLVSACSFAFASGGHAPAAGTGGTQVGMGGGKHVDQVQLPVELLPVLQISNRIGPADPSRMMSVAVGIPPADQAAFEGFADSVSDPYSPNFRQFITPEEVGARFGLPQERVQAIADYLASKGVTITLVASNRMAILCEGTVAQFEDAFSTTIDEYAVDPVLSPGDPGGNREFIAPSTPLMAPAAIAGDILDVFGLDTFVKPMPRTALTPTQTRVLYNAIVPYVNGFQGTGRTCGISNFDGYRLTNVPLYYSHYGLPLPPGGANSNVHVVTISGGGAGPGAPGGEGDLDIQMVLGMAPLCEFYIYDSINNLVATLTKEAQDNLCDVISESYGWNINSSTASSAHNQHVAMTAQGITYMAASGDNGTTLEPYSYPNYEPEVLLVGGTVATVQSNGTRITEVGWSGSGGGWSTNSISFNTRPSWQVGTGVNTSINKRMGPDLALQAAGSGNTGAYPFYYEGAIESTSVGTSFSSPVLAGLLAIGEQKLISLGGLPPNGAGKRRFGRLQNVIYAQDGRSDVWYDITSGNNGTLPNGSSSSAGVKFDMVTGWGAMKLDAFILTQVPPPCPADLNGSGTVDGTDLGILLSQWGGDGTADLNNDNIVDGTDLGILLAGWGNCPTS